MLKNERLSKIIDILHIHKYTTVDFLVNELHYSPATIRRDLVTLSNSGLIKKSYGGVGLNEYSKSVVVREHENVEDKKKIGVIAANLISDYDKILIIGSSTTYVLGTYISRSKNTTVFTTDMRLALYLDEKNIECYCLGGRASEGMLSGYITTNTLKQMNYDKCFFSVSSISNDGVMSSPSETFTEMIKTAMKYSKENICLCTSNKFGKSDLFSIGTLNDIDYIISNKEFSPNIKKEYKNTSFITT